MDSGSTVSDVHVTATPFPVTVTSAYSKASFYTRHVYRVCVSPLVSESLAVLLLASMRAYRKTAYDTETGCH
jgi:hypothetical protein